MTALQNTRLSGLDTLRAIAILAVLRFHLRWVAPNLLPQMTHFGWMGVDLFFVLSGYLIGSQLLHAHQRSTARGLWTFYRRRLFRILPAYLVVLTLYFVWPAWREAPGISPLWEFLSFTENLFVNYDKNQAFSHAWSLCIEEQFYLIMPLIVVAMMRRPSLRRTIGLMGALVAVGIAMRTWVFFHVLKPTGVADAGLFYLEHIYYPTWTRMDGLLAGVALALIRVHRRAWWESLMRRTHFLLLGGLALFAISLWLFNDRFTSQDGPAAWGTFIGFPLLSVALGLIVASAISPTGLLHRARIFGAQWIATLAYSLYLSHKAVAHLVDSRWPDLATDHVWASFFVYGAAVLSGAAILHYCVERPFLILRDRRKTSVEQELKLDPAI